MTALSLSDLYECAAVCCYGPDESQSQAVARLALPVADAPTVGSASSANLVSSWSHPRHVAPATPAVRWQYPPTSRLRPENPALYRQQCLLPSWSTACPRGFLDRPQGTRSGRSRVLVKRRRPILRNPPFELSFPAELSRGCARRRTPHQAEHPAVGGPQPRTRPIALPRAYATRLSAVGGRERLRGRQDLIELRGRVCRSRPAGGKSK